MAAGAVAGEAEEDLAVVALALLPLVPLLAALATVPLLSLRQGPHCPILHLRSVIKEVKRNDFLDYMINYQYLCRFNEVNIFLSNIQLFGLPII